MHLLGLQVSLKHVIAVCVIHRPHIRGQQLGRPGDAVLRNHDIAGTIAGSNDPKFVSYLLSTDTYNSTFNTAWDFHLQTGSPALTGAKTDFARNFSSAGIAINGVTYTSPGPQAFFGAFGTK